MNSKIVNTLEMMCDKENPQDRKLLLLAELVETKCEALAENQQELKESLKKTNEKLDKLTDILVKYEEIQDDCPVRKNTEHFKNLVFFVKHPKLSFLMIIGILALLIGVFSSTTTGVIKFLMGL